VAALLGLFAQFLLFTPVGLPGQEPEPVFSTTVFGSLIPGDGLTGKVYELLPNMPALPYFAAMRSVATLYTKTLNIPPQNFRAGIPGVPRIEWFAVDYTGDIWISKGGKYLFEILSDDGSRLYVDQGQVINNDGVHAPEVRRGAVSLKPGRHTLRVSYFQGPGEHIALVLTVKGPHFDWRIFNTDDFKAPDAEQTPCR
jgi:hypothetical protein